jgi:hypothetical protein
LPWLVLSVRKISARLYAKAECARLRRRRNSVWRVLTWAFDASSASTTRRSDALFDGAVGKDTVSSGDRFYDLARDELGHKVIHTAVTRFVFDA